ncbi:MAG: outer membrane protein assembly factor BamE [Alphaproteobacteria bacterium]|nr:outer membrane protein assembly factor BamE [Alphaproteobacteria bacterium]
MATILRLSVVLLVLVSIAACESRKATRGNFVTDTQMSQVTVGQTDRKTLVTLLGPPSTLGTFDSQVWYYIGRQTEQWAFLEPEVTSQRVYAIYFNDRNLVEHIEKYDKDDARQVEVVDRKTPTSGRSVTFFEQMIGNLGVLGGGSGGR